MAVYGEMKLTARLALVFVSTGAYLGLAALRRGGVVSLFFDPASNALVVAVVARPA